MSILREEPFILAQGQEVVVRVLAINFVGESATSELSNTHLQTGALVQQKPAKPT